MLRSAPEITKNSIKSGGVHLSVPSSTFAYSPQRLQNTAPVIIQTRSDESDNSTPKTAGLSVSNSSTSPTSIITAAIQSERRFALDLKNLGQNFSLDDGFNLLKLHVKDAEADGALNFIASTYDPYDMVIRDGIYPGGRKLITFANILQHDVFPLARILQLAQKYGQGEMRRPVEIEFAVNFDARTKSGIFYLLQIRPMVDNKMMLDEDLTEIPDEKTLIRSHNAIGQGVSNEVYDVVYVKTDDYSAYNNPAIADEIDRINRRFLEEGRNYVLVGPGRWGSSDPWLGVPVKWPNISAARVIVESGLTNYRVDPSQGTHFFQNLTSFGVGYFTVNDFLGDGVYNQAFLNSQPAVEETAHVRHVRFSSPVVIKVDGMKKEGVVMLPGVE